MPTLPDGTPAPAPAAPADDYDDHPDAPRAPVAAAPPVAPVPPSPPAAAPTPSSAEQGVAHQHLPQVQPATIIAATWESLQAKHARRTTVNVPSVGPDGEQILLEVKMIAINNVAYDRILDAYPPSRDDQAKGAIWDRKKFPPALLAEVVTSPKLTVEQWLQLSTDDNWSGGEFGDLFAYANRLCQGGLDVPFTGRG